MIIDERLEFSDAQALTGTAALTDVIDFGSARQLGVGEPLYWVLSVDVASDRTTGDETYSFALQTDDNSAFSSAATLITYAFPAAVVPAGTRIAFALPTNLIERYLRVNATLGGTTPTVTISSWIGVEPTNATIYPDAVN